MAGDEIERSQRVHQIWPVAASTELSETSCVLCGSELTAGEAWRVTLERTGNVITCQPCAARARREGDLTWLGTASSSGEAELAAETDEIKRDLLAACSHLYDSSDVNEAGVSDAIDRVVEELDHPDEDDRPSTPRAPTWQTSPVTRGLPMSVRISVILDRKGREVVTIRPEATIEEAAQQLAAHRIGALVVSADGRTVAGIISERDIVTRLAESGAAILAMAVADLMTTAVTTCTSEQTADELMKTMTEERHRHVPVVEEGELVGLVSIGDVVKSHTDELETQVEALEGYVTGSAY